MDLDREVAIVEAVLHLESEPADIRSLARITGLAAEVVKACLDSLIESTAKPDRGVELVMIGDSYQLQPKFDLWPSLRERYGKKNEKRLSRAAMETLSIIAYAQPVTRAEIENIRGVSPDGMIRTLMSRNLIEEVGHKDTPGRPVQYGTTLAFLRQFRLRSISDLPKLDELEERRFADENDAE